MVLKEKQQVNTPAVVLAIEELDRNPRALGQNQGRSSVQNDPEKPGRTMHARKEEEEKEVVLLKLHETLPSSSVGTVSLMWADVPQANIAETAGMDSEPSVRSTDRNVEVGRWDGVLACRQTTTRSRSRVAPWYIFHHRPSKASGRRWSSLMR